MNSNTKVVWTVIIIILIGLIGWAAYSYWMPVGSGTPTPSDEVTPSPSDGNPGGTVVTAKVPFTVVVPKTLSASETATTLTLEHSIAFKNRFCDFKGDAPEKTRMTDFKITMRLSSKNVQGAVLEQNPSFDKTNFAGAGLRYSEGFITRSDEGDYVGYAVTESVEGCGQVEYFYPVSPTKTLVIVREMPFAFSTAADAGTRAKVLAVPGVIAPDSADLLFSSIMNSFALKAPLSTVTLKTYTSSVGWKIDSPTTFATDANYFYKGLSSGKTLPGIAFRAPASYKTGTNLSEAYVSVEKNPAAVKCTADEFLADTGIVTAPQTVQLNGIVFTKASTSDAAAGNRYEETVYAAKGSSGCYGIRYFVHYGVIHNYEPIIYPFNAAELQSIYMRMVATFKFTK